MGDSSDQPEGLEGQHGDDATAKVGANEVNNCDHEDADDGVRFE